MKKRKKTSGTHLRDRLRKVWNKSSRAHPCDRLRESRLTRFIDHVKSTKKAGSLVRLGRQVVREVDDNSRQAVILQYRTLMDLLEENKDTAYGRRFGFSGIHTVEDFKAKVPFSVYDDYAPYIRRMMDGEENLLTSCPPSHYALTSGSIGTPKYIPVSAKELRKYTRYSAYMAFGVADEYYRNTTGEGAPAGPGLNAIELKVTGTRDGTGMGVISGTVMESMKEYVPYMLSAPWEVIRPGEAMDMKYLKTRLALQCRDLAFMDSVFMTGLVDLMDYIRDHYEMLCRDIYYGRINRKVEVPDSVRAALAQQLLPDRARAKELMREFRQGFDTPIIPRIWPRMSWIGGIGTGGFYPYSRRMRAYSGKSIPFNNMCYAASESFMAVARHMADDAYVLLPDGGFYEFIPVGGEATAPSHQKTAKQPLEATTETKTIEELEVGEDYEIVVTNLSGFYRYRLMDVVRVTDFYNEAPLLRFLYRKDQLISIAGEKTSEESLRRAVDDFQRSVRIPINDYSVFADRSTSPGHYVILLEPDHVVPKDLLTHCRDVMEEKMMQANPSYGEKIRSRVLAPLAIVFLQQQTYQLYRDLMIMRGASANQLKPVRVIDTPMKERFFFGLREKYKEGK